MSLVEAIEHDRVQTESRKGDVVLEEKKSTPKLINKARSGKPFKKVVARVKDTDNKTIKQQVQAVRFKQSKSNSGRVVASSLAQGHLLLSKRSRKVEHSGAEAAALASAISAENTVIPLLSDAVALYAKCFAVLTSFDLQSAGSNPTFASASPTWSPSQLAAYYYAVFAYHFTRASIISVPSSSFLNMGQFVVPPMVALWLQQLGKARHDGRDIVHKYDTDVSVMLSTNFGDGGLDSSFELQAAPCATTATYALPEPLWTITQGEPQMTPNNQAAYFSTVSTLIKTHYDDRSVHVADIGVNASNCELKCTPLFKGQNNAVGTVAFSCPAENEACNLLLVLCAGNGPVMTSSPYTILINSLVRLDTAMTPNQSQKMSFLWWLVSKYGFHGKKDSFRKHLYKYGFQDINMHSIQINARQINWVSLLSTITQSINYYGVTDPQQAYFAICYFLSVVYNTVPPCFRAGQIWADNVQGYPTPCFKPNQSAMYAPPAIKNVKLPPFLNQLKSMLEGPIRDGSRIMTPYIQMFDSSTNWVWWNAIAENANYSLPVGPYGLKPIGMNNCGMQIAASTPLIPYPDFNVFGAIPANTWPNYFPMGIAAVGPALQKFEGSSRWYAGRSILRRRGLRFFTNTTLRGNVLITDNSTGSITCEGVVVQSVVSVEPVGKLPALAECTNTISYVLGYSNNGYATTGNFGTKAKTTLNTPTQAIAAADPVPGTSLANEAASKSNVSEFLSLKAASAGEGAIPDNSETVPEHETGKVAKEMISRTGEAADKTISVLNKGATTLSKMEKLIAPTITL